MSGITETVKLYQELGTIRRELQEVKEQMAEFLAVARQGTTAERSHITRDPLMHDGEPTIQGSAIMVRTIVERTRLGDTPEQIIEAYPVLTLAQVHAALGYYYDHPGEIDTYIQQNREALWLTKPRSSS